MRTNHNRRPSAIFLWTVIVLLSSIFFVVLFFAITTFWVAYEHRDSAASWLPFTASLVLIPVLAYFWIQTLRACYRKLTRVDLL